MRIAFITRNYPPTICGIGDHTFYLAQEMKRQNHDIHIVCGADQKENFDDENTHPIVSEWNINGVRKVTNLLNTLQIDWVIVQYEAYGYNAKGFPYPFLYLYFLLNKSNIPILTVFHEVMIRKEGNFKKTVLSISMTTLAKMLCRLSNKVVTSIDFYARILNQNPNKLSIIPIGSNILPTEITPDEQAKLREKYNIPGDAPVIVTFGQRDISPYLKTFDLLKKTFPKLVWLVCGKTATPLSILDNCGYIRHTGKMSAEDIHRHLSLGNVFFMPDYVSETGEGGSCNKSGTLACAFSLGIPIVGTKGDMNNALLKDGENILLTDLNLPDALFQNLKKCLLSPQFADALSQNAKETYQKSLKWDVIAQQFLALI